MLAESAKSARWTDVLYTAHTREPEHIRKVWKAPTLGSLYNLAPSQYLQIKHAPPDNPQGVPGLKTRREIINLLLGTAGVEYLGKHHRSGVDVYYCNAGDTYTTTICFAGRRLFLTSWGYLVESGIVRTYNCHTGGYD